ncbi:MAG TPA: mechanosensitive ion channel family protein [Vicinamibacterales bacterium]|nr:mechanosensitive ion channel family protein [Vicinamibacterales bacterium]
MPANWPELTLALALVVVAAYLVADFVSRRVESVLRTIVPEERGHLLVESPRAVVRTLIFLITAAALSIPALRLVGYRSLFRNPEAFTEWVLSAGLRIAVIAVAAYIIIRVGTAAARRFERAMSAGTGLNVIERTKRARTLGRLLQSTLVAVVVVIAGLTVLRELGIDITPALTGAGIVGLAVGFGAQTLVRDVISGFFLILEDQVRVGDAAVVNGQGGIVEAVNLRTIALRDEEGTVHVFPNGEVKTLANRSKDFAYYVITVGVSWDEDPDRVAEAMTAAAETLQTDPEMRVHILEPLEVYGVDGFEAAHLVLKARIKTVPMKQWVVGRELRKRIARIFRERGIRVAGTQVVQIATQKRDTAS